MNEDIHIYKNARDYYVSQICVGTYENGTPKYKRFSSKKKKEAYNKAAEYREKNIGLSDKAESCLSDYLLHYMVTVKKNTLKPASYSRSLGTVCKSINPYIGHYTLAELKPTIIQKELINALVDKGYSHSTIHKAYVLLNAAMKYAVLNEILIKNPCNGVNEPSKNNFDSKIARCLNDDEIDAFIASARSSNKKNVLAVASIIYTGLRAGELCALKWEDIDFDKKTLTINKNVTTYYDEGSDEQDKKRVTKVQNSTKTSGGRIIPLSNKAAELLLEHKTRCGIRRPSDFVLDTNRPLSAGIISDIYKVIAKNAGIKNAMGAHTLRHTFCSLLIRRNIDIKVVSELVGHKTVSFTYNTYIHVIDKQRAEAMNLLDF